MIWRRRKSTYRNAEQWYASAQGYTLEVRASEHRFRVEITKVFEGHRHTYFSELCDTVEAGKALIVAWLARGTR